MKINLRESLNKIDLATDNKYDLLNTFDSKKLSDNSKKKLAEAIDNNSIASINRVLHESSEQLYKVVISSGATKRNFESALYEDEAEGIVDYYGGRWIDENGFEWSMYVEEDNDSTEHAMVDDGQSFESLKEASYGGAYDIEDDMFFTKEEIVEFADEVCVYLEDIFGYQYNISDVYMDGPRKLYINIYDNNYIEVESTFDIDMRKIRKPSDLFKFYGLDIENWFQKAFAREYRDAGLDESLTEDTIKQKGESLNEQKYSSGNYFITVDKTGMGPHYSLYYQHPHSDYDGLMFIVDGYGYDNFKEKLSKFSTVYPNEDVQNLLKNIKKNVPGLQDESLKEAIDDEIDLDYETDFDDNEVEEGNHVFADGEEYVWVERIAGPIYLDFDKWAVWSARVFVDPRDFMTIHSDGKNYDFDGDAFKEKAMAAPIVYFVVEEDTGFIDWGPVESRIEAQDFLNGKQEDWDNDEYYGESLEKNLNEWYVHTLHYEDIGDGREYDYEVDHEEVLDYLSEIAIDEEDAPEDTEEYLKWVEDNFDELFNKYKYEIEEHFREDASQEEYNRRHSSYES